MNESANPSGTQTNELMAFRMQDQEYAIDVMAVRELRGWTPATSLPHSPSYVVGVINLRGTVLPVIDLSLRMGFAPTQATSRHAIIVVEIASQIIGLLVESVSEIFTATVQEIQPTPEVGSESASSSVIGVIPKSGRMISVISLSSIPVVAAEMAA